MAAHAVKLQVIAVLPPHVGEDARSQYTLIPVVVYARRRRLVTEGYTTVLGY